MGFRLIPILQDNMNCCLLQCYSILGNTCAPAEGLTTGKELPGERSTENLIITKFSTEAVKAIEKVNGFLFKSYVFPL